MVYKDGRTDPLRHARWRTTGLNSKTYQDARTSYRLKYLPDGPARQNCRNVLQRHGLRLRSRRWRKDVQLFAPGLAEPDVLTWQQVQDYVARLQALDACRRARKEHTTDTQKDLQQIKVELYKAGYKLLTPTPGAYLIQHAVYDSLTAGTAERPLSLDEVEAFAYGGR